MENEDYASDSDQSDEDYCPLKEKTEILSEEESGDESDANSEPDNGEASSKTTKRKSTKTKSAATKSSARKRKSSVAEENKSEVEVPDAIGVQDDKSHADALWASFLGDSEPNSNKSQPAIKKVIVTETVEFAGEQIEVRKEVAVRNNVKEDLFAVSGSKTSRVRTGAEDVIKSPIGLGSLANLRKQSVGFAPKPSGGLSSVLGQIGKKNKISVLEKTSLDWKTFKNSEGIDEQLQTHNKGKDGYLERQDFLQRTDVRQFEIEKDLRQAKRSNR